MTARASVTEVASAHLLTKTIISAFIHHPIAHYFFHKHLIQSSIRTFFIMLFRLFCTATAFLLRTVTSQHVTPGRFEPAGHSGVPVMHAALLPNGHVVFLDKLENYTEARLQDGRYAYSTVYNPLNLELEPQAIPSNAFCCGGAFLADGTLMTMGGNGPLTWLDDSIADGFDALRYLYDNEKSGDWIEHAGVKMSSRR